MERNRITPAEYPDPVYGAIPDEGRLVCVQTRLIPYVCEALKTLLRRSSWIDETSFMLAEQDILEFKEQLVSGCSLQILTDIGVLLARSHNLTYSVALDAPMPALATALQTAEAADATGVLDTIHNHLDRLDRINASLGYNAGLENDDPSYDAADTLKAQKGQIKAMLEAKLGFSGGGDIETSLEEIRLAVSGQTDEEVRDILAAILAML